MMDHSHGVGDSPALPMEPEKKKDDKRVVQVKKNLIDQTAALSYSMGVSIVHLAMLICLQLIKQVDLTKVEGMDPGEEGAYNPCWAEANELDYLMRYSFVCHIILFIGNSYREVFSAKTDMFGQFMRLVEIACIPIYLTQILMSVEILSIAMIRQTIPMDASGVAKPVADWSDARTNFLGGHNNKNPQLLKCDLETFQSFSGSCVEWLVIEVFVFGFFIFTMLITMCKSRFFIVGTDNSMQFEDVYMGKMANKIAAQIKLEDRLNTKENKKDDNSIKNSFVDHERMVQVQGVNIKVQINDNELKNIMDSSKEIDPNNAKAWIQEFIVGRITKKELDDERLKETNSLDMMQNSNIIYHTESITEMQTLVLGLMIFMTWTWEEYYGAGATVINANTAVFSAISQEYLDSKAAVMIIIWACLAEHVMSVGFSIYRKQELREFGKPNNYGVEWSECEFYLRIFEFLLDVGLAAWIVVTVAGMSITTFHSMPFLNYWLIIEAVIMTSTIPYIYMARVLMMSGEITKNIFTLY